MPAQFLHFVLTRSDTVDIGTNFLAEGQSDEICKAIAEEDALPDRLKSQNLIEMLAILKPTERSIVTRGLIRCVDALTFVTANKKRNKYWRENKD